MSAAGIYTQGHDAKSKTKATHVKATRPDYIGLGYVFSASFAIRIAERSSIVIELSLIHI